MKNSLIILAHKLRNKLSQLESHHVDSSKGTENLHWAKLDDHDKEIIRNLEESRRFVEQHILPKLKQSDSTQIEQLNKEFDNILNKYY